MLYLGTQKIASTNKTEGGTGKPVINREVSSQGDYGMPTQNFTFTLPSNATDLGDYALRYAFYRCTSLTSVDLSSLTTITGEYALERSFQECTNLTSVDLSGLVDAPRYHAMASAFADCPALSLVDLSGLTTLSGDAFYYTFGNCTSLISIDLSSLTTVSGTNALLYAFYYCRNLTSVDISNLAVLSGSTALGNAFYGCTSLTTLSFPALNSSSFGSRTNQFNKMLSGVTGCTVHFPSNLQSVIGSWSDVTAGFGGTNTTVLWDLPATT